jgi:hypothetical protein
MSLPRNLTLIKPGNMCKMKGNPPANIHTVAGSIPDGVLEYFTGEVLPVDSSLNRNECQEYFLEGKGDRCVRLTNLHFRVPIVMTSGILNILKISGHFQTCIGIDMPLTYHLIT